MFLLHIAVGGGLGSLARFALSGWVTTWAGVGFPWGTFAANLIGSVLLGTLSATLPHTSTSPSTRALLTVGFCGGFTTFSTFDLEMMVLLRQDELLLAFAYAATSVLLCIGAVAAGLAVGSRYSLRRTPT